MKKRNLFLSIATAAVVSATTSVGIVKYYSDSTSVVVSEKNINEQVQTQSVSFKQFNAAAPPNLDFTKSAESSLKGVVLIGNYQESGSRNRDPFLEQFFGGTHQHPESGRVLQLAGIGSGVIITPDGFIATNNHVVDGAAKLTVILDNKKKYTATLVGVDPTTDLALLKINAESLQYITFGNSDDTKVGEWVLAVGHPYNLGATVTAGIISAKARSIGILRKNNLGIESFIQTDAAVNPGNSGGALVNVKGELIGINSAIASPTGSFAGYSFAIPSAIVKKVVADLKEFGKVQRALLGVAIQDVSAELITLKDLKVERGVYISGASPNGAAALAGLEVGDVITKVDERTIETASELQEYLGQFRPGDKVKVSYKRGDDLKLTTIVLKNKLGTTSMMK